MAGLEEAGHRGLQEPHPDSERLVDGREMRSTRHLSSRTWQVLSLLWHVLQRPQLYVLSVETAGECGEEEQVVRSAGGSKVGQPSVQDRRAVIEAADCRLAIQCAATPSPSAVEVCLEPDSQPRMQTTMFFQLLCYLFAMGFESPLSALF